MLLLHMPPATGILLHSPALLHQCCQPIHLLGDVALVLQAHGRRGEAAGAGEKWRQRQAKVSNSKTEPFPLLEQGSWARQ